MAYEQRDDSGALFKNDKRESEAQPNARGDALIGGKPYWVSAWTKTDKNGNKFQSLAFVLKEQKPAQQAATGFEDMSDDIPFS